MSSNSHSCQGCGGWRGRVHTQPQHQAGIRTCVCQVLPFPAPASPQLPTWPGAMVHTRAARGQWLTFAFLAISLLFQPQPRSASPPALSLGPTLALTGASFFWPMACMSLRQAKVPAPAPSRTLLRTQMGPWGLGRGCFGSPSAYHVLL